MDDVHSFSSPTSYTTSEKQPLSDSDSSRFKHAQILSHKLTRIFWHCHLTWYAFLSMVQLHWLNLNSYLKKKKRGFSLFISNKTKISLSWTIIQCTENSYSPENVAIGISNTILKLVLDCFFSYCLMSYIVLYRINSLHSNEECCTFATSFPRYCVACSQLNSGAIWPCVLWYPWPLSLPLSLRVISIGRKHATVENNNWKRTSIHGWI